MVKVQRIVFNAFQVNTYIVYNNTGECIIIDPACNGQAESDAMKTFINDKGLKPILHLNTHCHFDHVVGIPFVKDTWHTASGAHEKEMDILEHAPLMGSLYGLELDHIPIIEHRIKHNESIKIGNSELIALLVPGHSPGSLSFYSKDGGFVITGDALFEGSIGRTDLPGGDYDTLIESIRNHLFTLPDETVIYPGHGNSSTIENEKNSNPFFNT